MATPDGRLLVSAPEPVPELPVGGEVTAAGTVREPDDFERGYLAIHGVARVVEANAIEPTGESRGGIAGITDGMRTRAEEALERGTPPPEAALLRGFVLGQDDRISAVTVEEFQRSGLAHLLAVSGQNVVLLAILATALMAVAGVPLPARLACILGLIALYVPIAGAGASIQRAGVMGAAGVIAALAGRPAARWYALLLAAAVTLAINPRVTGDVGWQLSFAAVAGIALWAAPLRDAVAGSRPGRPRRALAEGLAVTVAATVATAPLMAHHFGQLSVASLAANLLALPAVAPVMWLGMLAAAAGQVPWLPVEPLTALAGVCAGYVEQIARWSAAPAWAQVGVPAAGVPAVAAVYAWLVLAGAVGARVAAARRGLAPPRGPVALAGALAGLVVCLVAARLAGSEPAAGAGLRVSVLDVGQGDAILLDPQPGAPVLVDTGPPGAGLAADLGEVAAEGLAAVVVTHDEDDHSGGLADLLADVPVPRLVYGQPSRRLLRLAGAGGIPATQLTEGSQLRSGELRIEALWPPRALVDAGAGRVPRPTDPNLRSLVLLARWRGFRMLLTGDAEAEAVPIDPGAVDVLKVAHHGSEDAGLGRLLDASVPALAVISAGARNPFGHPTASTLEELSERGVQTWRTDLDGPATIEVGAAGWSVHETE